MWCPVDPVPLLYVCSRPRRPLCGLGCSWPYGKLPALVPRLCLPILSATFCHGAQVSAHRASKVQGEADRVSEAWLSSDLGLRRHVGKKDSLIRWGPTESPEVVNWTT